MTQVEQKGWIVIAPNGYWLPSTFSVQKSTAMRRALSPPEQKYHGLVNNNFAKWEAKGYRVERVTMKFTL